LVDEKNGSEKKTETDTPVTENAPAPPSTIGTTPAPNHLSDVEQGK
jgi:hypothetical protein